MGAEMVISDKIKKLVKIGINKILNDSLKELVDFIVDLNKEQLYVRGDIDVNYPGLKEHYAESTIKQKRKKATYKKTDFVTLRWEGDFYSGFELELRDKDFIIRTSDPKRKFLLEESKNFGNRFVNALGLTEESKEELRDKIKPVIIQKIRNEL